MSAFRLPRPIPRIIERKQRATIGTIAILSLRPLRVARYQSYGGSYMENGMQKQSVRTLSAAGADRTEAIWGPRAETDSDLLALAHQID